MLFTSAEFIMFLAVTVFLYYIVPRRWQWRLLLIANGVFYYAAGIKGFAYILITIVTVYILSIRIDRLNAEEKEQIAENKGQWSREEKKKYKATMKKRRRLYLAAGVLINFGILVVLKYTNFVITTANDLLYGGEGKFQLVDLFVPLGISFYTFQIMGYLIDIYYGKYRAEKNIFKLALFTSFFPQLIQGPISRYGKLSTTLFEEHKFDFRNIKFGLERILWGYFKKMVIADRVMAGVKAVSGNTVEYTGAFVVVGMIFYAIQLYADFSGGIDITIGIGQMMGITVQENFERPYFSKNIAEYWRRWHISLGEWFKEYIFYPISIGEGMMNLTKKARKKFGDNFGKKIPIYIATIVTWALTGLWHGAAAYFLVWGLLNCAVILISEEFKPLYAKFHQRFPKLENTTGYRAFQVMRTVCLMSCLRMFDCYQNVGLTFKMFESIFKDFDIAVISVSSLTALGLSVADYAVILIGVLIMFIVSMLQRRESVRIRLEKKGYVLETITFAVLFICIIIFGAYGIGYDASQFIYNQF